jgi:acyl-CoA reductase-like NAD-dependent aldehyde dehydrogenase
LVCYPRVRASPWTAATLALALTLTLALALTLTLALTLSLTAEGVKRVVLELGGKGPNLIFADLGPELATAVRP